MVALAIAPALVGCDRAGGGTIAPNDPILLQGEWRVIPLRHGAMMLRQGSRDVPAPADRFFTPTVSEIVELERALTERLERDGYFAATLVMVVREAEANGVIVERPGMTMTLQQNWCREYIGIERGGRRGVYGNFSLRHRPAPTHDYDRTLPTVVDDGGPTFFGAEYDLGTGAISHLSFNGP